MDRVLIIKLGALGDIIMSTPLIRQIQEQFADDEVSLLTSTAFSPLFENWPRLRLQGFPRKGWANAFKMLAWVRRQGFSCLFDLQSNDRSGMLCALSGVPRRTGNHPRFPYHLHPQGKWTGEGHIFDRMLEVLRAGGINAKHELPSLPVSDEDQAKVDSWLQTNKLERQALVLAHAGGAPQHPQKRWPYFAGLAQRLEKADYRVIWVGAHADAQLNRALAENSGIDASNMFSLQQLIALGQRSRFAITNDSGPMHVLSCCGKPVYGLFGPTDWRRNHAIGQREHVISLDIDKPRFAASSLKDLDLDLVVEKLSLDGFL